MMVDATRGTMRSRSIYVASFPDDLEATPSGVAIDDGGCPQAPPAGDAVTDIRDNDDGGDDGDGAVGADSFELPQSTHMLLFTEPVCSLPFAFAVVILVLSLTCLRLAEEGLGFTNRDGDDSWNLDTVPVNVSKSVRAAQYLSIFVALLMEEGENFRKPYCIQLIMLHLNLILMMCF